MDYSDTATKREEEFLSDALARAQESIRSARTQATNECIDCGEDIPPERKEAQPHCCRCVECQDRLERRGK